MLFYTLTIKDTDYKCRLSAKTCVELEKKMGTNPLNVLARMANTNELPDLEDLLTILQYSMTTYQHGITLDTVYDLYDQYVDEGHLLTDLIQVIVEIFKASGFINPEVEASGKN